MKFLLYFILALVSIETGAQIQISGEVKDAAGQPIPFATIYLDETFEGGASDMEGRFRFQTTAKGTVTLVSSAVGFETKKQTITLEG